jgi:hypothetical protein
MPQKRVPRWVGDCPKDIAELVAFLDKRAAWLHEYVADEDVMSGRGLGEVGGEFSHDIRAWVFPPKPPRTDGQWIDRNARGELTAVLPSDASRDPTKPRTLSKLRLPLYVAEWANRVLTASNSWLDAHGPGGYPVWTGNRIPPRIADELLDPQAVKLAKHLESQYWRDMESVPSNLRRADLHLSRLLSWCHGAADNLSKRPDKVAVAETSAAGAAEGSSAGKPAAGGKNKQTRTGATEANLCARKALKGKPPKGRRRWTCRSLAKAIGCSSGLVPDLPAWQAYAEDHGLKRHAKDHALKAVSLTKPLLELKGQEDNRHR